MRRDRHLLVIVSGTLGDVLPIARLVSAVPADVAVTVVTNEVYVPLFPGRETATLPFDPRAVIASRAGQRMVEGGLLGVHRLTGMYGVVHPQIDPTVEAVAKRIHDATHVIVAGIPFGTEQLAAPWSVPVLRVLYQPHWPNTRIKSLYANSRGDWGTIGNAISHYFAEGLAQLFFRRELLRSISAHQCEMAAGHKPALRTLLHESYFHRHRTLLSFTDAFSHEGLKRSSWATFTGFIRPQDVPLSPAYDSALARLDGQKRPIIYCGFGSMKSRKTSEVAKAVARAARSLGVGLAIQGGAGAVQADGHLVHRVPFGDHRRLFPLCAGLIHHGGAGTVVASLDAERPFTVVPQWADQFYWAQRTEELGLAVPHEGNGQDWRAWSRTITNLLTVGRDPEYGRRARRVAGADGFVVASQEVARFLDS